MDSDNKRTSTSEHMLSQKQKIQLEKFVSRIKSEIVYMPAGAFLMRGGSEMRNGGMFCTRDKNNNPAHQMIISAFSISKFKITHENYGFN